MHAQSGTVGHPEFNGLVLKYEVSVRITEAQLKEVTNVGGLKSALAGDIADLVNEMFEDGLLPEYWPEIGVRAL